MKKKLKQLLIMLPVLTLLVITTVKAQESMHIKLNDGTVIEIPIADIQKLTFDLTAAIEHHPEVVKQLLKLKIYPNPAGEQLAINYSLMQEGTVTIDIFNMNGLLLEKKNLGFRGAGDYRYTLNTQYLHAGTYIFLIRQNDQFVTEKIIIKD
jgi:hypothetical protein